MPMVSKSHVSRREMLRCVVRAGAALPFVTTGHPFLAHLHNATLDRAEAALAGADWTPRFITAAQNDLLIAVSEAIVPGSRAAEVNRFIDLLLSVDTKENQHAFIQSLSAIDAATAKQFGKSFSALSTTEQASLLMAVSTPSQDSASKPEGDETSLNRAHFHNLKAWVSGAYYSSEAGMKELGWTPDRAFHHFPPCDASDGHA